MKKLFSFVTRDTVIFLLTCVGDGIVTAAIGALGAWIEAYGLSNGWWSL